MKTLNLPTSRKTVGPADVLAAMGWRTQQWCSQNGVTGASAYTARNHLKVQQGTVVDSFASDDPSFVLSSLVDTSLIGHQLIGSEVVAPHSGEIEYLFGATETVQQGVMLTTMTSAGVVINRPATIQKFSAFGRQVTQHVEVVGRQLRWYLHAPTAVIHQCKSDDGALGAVIPPEMLPAVVTAHEVGDVWLQSTRAKRLEVFRITSWNEVFLNGTPCLDDAMIGVMRKIAASVAHAAATWSRPALPPPPKAAPSPPPIDADVREPTIAEQVVQELSKIPDDLRETLLAMLKSLNQTIQQAGQHVREPSQDSSGEVSLYDFWKLTEGEFGVSCVRGYAWLRDRQIVTKAKNNPWGLEEYMPTAQFARRGLFSVRAAKVSIPEVDSESGRKTGCAVRAQRRTVYLTNDTKDAAGNVTRVGGLTWLRKQVADAPELLLHRLVLQNQGKAPWSAVQTGWSCRMFHQKVAMPACGLYGRAALRLADGGDYTDLINIAPMLAPKQIGILRGERSWTAIANNTTVVATTLADALTGLVSSLHGSK